MKLMSNSLFYAAAAATAIAGIMHLIFTSNVIESNLLSGTFFIVAGIAQIFCPYLWQEDGAKGGTISELQVLWY